MFDPLTGGTTGARKMAASLLTYANRAKVADALTAAGYSVTRVTVNRWAAGKEMPGIAARMILELFGHETTEKTQPGEPDWAIAMKSQIVAELQVNRQLIEALLPPQALRNAEELIRRLEAQLPTPAEAAPGRSEPPDPAGEAPQAQADEPPPVRDGGR